MRLHFVFFILPILLLFVGNTPHAADNYVFNMQDADIRTMISTVAEITGKNFIIDPSVKGKVTIISQQGMQASEIYKIFLSLLDVHGFSVIPTVEANTYKIIRAVNAKSQGVPLDTDNIFQGDQLVTRIIAVKHSQAAQLVQVLRPLVPQQAYLAAFPESNMIIISDSANNINRLVALVKRIDRPGDGSIEMIRLNNASAKELSHTLALLTKSDTVLSQSITADERTNSLLISGTPSTRIKLRSLIAKLDSAVDALSTTHVVYLHYAKATNIMKVLNDLVKIDESQEGLSRQSDILISADEASNALILKASFAKFRELKSVITRLDIPQAQVHIEAIIAEVSYDLEKELGIEWNTRQSDSGSGVYTAARNGLRLKDIFTLSYFSGSDIQAVLRVLQSDTDTNILATPSLLTLDNQQASIVVGENVPFLTGTQQTQDGLANPFQTIERRDVGLTLKVTPRLNKGSTIIMEIDQEISSVVPKIQNLQAVDIVTRKRQIKTTVMVEDNGMVVLGGLIQDELVNNQQQVPILGDIPIIGNLFKSSKNEIKKANLMIFIRPTIVTNPIVANKLAMEKYQFLQHKQLQQQAGGIRLVDSRNIPVLPDVPPTTIQSRSGSLLRRSGVSLPTPVITSVATVQKKSLVVLPSPFSD
jgi:general secretion pathway protein D